MNYETVIVIGAPRSGTNILRDVLCELSGVATWPCDEINYIWRHGNIRYPSDEFSPELARPSVRKYIQHHFDSMAARAGAHTLVEKTCANSLRVPFVDAVISRSKYIFIRRDGLDIVASAMQRWTAKLDIGYLARKARFVPPSDLPYYGSRYFVNRVYRLLSREERLAFWGPKFEGMKEFAAQHPLDEVCMLQWKVCVDKAMDAFAAMPKDRWLEVAYEDFVSRPMNMLERIATFIGVEASSEELQAAVARVHDSSVGKGRAALSDETRQRLRAMARDTLARLDYA